MKVDIINSRTVAYSLSVVMFLTTTAPPIWTHCHQESLDHEEWCEEQQETHADDDPCCEAHAAHCSAQRQCDEVEQHCSAVECNRNISHYHVVWLGMTARVPVDKQSEQPNDESQRTAILNRAFVPLRESGSPSRIECPADLEVSTVIVHVLPQLIDRTDMPSDTLLCDVARRERTGVLVV